MLKKRLDDFIDYIDICHLPDLGEGFGYFVEVRTDAIVLYIKFVVEYKYISETNKKIFDTSDEYEIINLPFKLLTIEEYAKLNDTTSYVVAQWIRRGKLKNAKKIGREWYIPEIEEITKDTKEAVYMWKTTNEKIFNEEYDNFNRYNKAIIRQSAESKLKFLFILYDDYTGNSEEKLLDTKEKQKIETMLIGNNKVKYTNNLIISLV